MINRVVLVGRLTKDIEIRKTTSGLSTARFTLACDKRVSKEQKDNQNSPTADFVPCVAWRGSADYLGNYARKGSVVGIEGRITTGSYEGQNGRVYTTDVTCDSVRIIANGRDNQQGQQTQSQSYSAPANSNQTYQAPRQSAPAPSYEQPPLYQAPNTSGQYSSNYDDEFGGTPSLDISSDDLPFY